LLTLFGLNAIDEDENAIGLIRNFTYAYWLLCDFSDQCENRW